MKLRSLRKFGRLSAFAAGVSLATSGFAQTVAPVAPTTSTAPAPGVTATDADSTVKLEKIVVTGSNIPSTLTSGEAGALPVISMTRADIDKSGFTTAADLLQKMTVSNGGAVPISNNATGFTPAASSTSIHGLGPEATLVLVNGHRVANYPIGSGGQSAFVDLNSIALSSVERIEVLTSGASAIYGADAVAGVVNIIMRKNFDGAEATVRYGNTTNKDSHEVVANYVQGVSDDNGSLTAGLSYYVRAAIFNRDRSYSAIPPYLSSNAVPINAQITTAAYDQALGLPAGTRPAGVTSDVFFADPGIFPSATGGNHVSPDGNIVTGSTNTGNTPASQYIYSNGRQSVWNFNQTSGAYPEFRHYGAFINGERGLFGAKNIKGYWDASYSHNFSESQLAPLATGSFTTPGAVEYVIPANTANPLPLPDGRARAAVIGAYNPYNPYNIDITGGTRFRLFEFGNRILKTDNDAFMATAGIKMTNVFGSWDFDAGMRYSTIAVHQDFQLVSTSRFNQILNQNDPIFNPASSTYIGTTHAYNPFGYAPDQPIPGNAATVAYATVRVKDQSSTGLSNPFFTASTGHLFSLPAGDAGAAAGVDYRVESQHSNPDAISLLGDDGSGQEFYVNESRKVIAYFGEVSLPVFSPKEKIPGAYDLSLDVAGRYEDFMTANVSKFLPSFALRYQPFDNTLTVRASYGEGIRQPSLFELYNGVVNGLQSLIDPRDASSLPENPIQSASNPKLQPETSTTYTAGIIWSPKGAMKGFTINADYWHVEREGTVYAAAQDVLDRYFGKHPDGTPAPGGLLPGESVLLDGSGNILSVTAPYHNMGKTIAQGIDMGASYFLQTNSAGRFDFAAGGTYLESYKQAVVAGVPLDELVNTDASQGQGLDGYVRWKAKANVDWTKGSMLARVVCNYTTGFEDLDADGNTYQVASFTTFDVQFAYTVHKQLGRYLDNTTLTVGAFNVLDKDPPASSGFGSNATGYPGFMYDSTGRFVYAQLTKKF